MSYKHCTQTIITGVERSGKTYFAEKLCNVMHKNGKTAIVYNKGNDSDFSDFEEIEILDKGDTYVYIMENKGKAEARKYTWRSDVRYFEYKEKIYHFSRFNAILGGKKISIPRVELEDLFFKAMYSYVGNCFFIGDDFRVVTRQGVQANLINLTARKNHTGKKSTSKSVPKGSHLSFIYHNLDLVNNEIFHYATHLIMYYTGIKPALKQLNDERLKPLIWEAYELNRKGKMQKGEEYFDAYQINIRGANSYTITPLKGEQIKKI